MKYRNGTRWGGTATLALTTILFTSATTARAEDLSGGGCDPAVYCPGPDVPTNPADGQYKEAIALIKNIGSALEDKAISTALEFLIKLSGILGPSELELAKREILDAIRSSEADTVKANVGGALTSLGTVLGDPMNQMYNTPLLSSITTQINFAINNIAQINGRKDAALSYMVAPSLAVAVSVGAAASKLQNRPLSDQTMYFQSMMNMGMDMVGLDVTYPDGKAFYETSDSKLLWTKADLGGMKGSHPDPDGYHLCTSPEARADIASIPNSTIACSARTEFCYLTLFRTTLSVKEHTPRCWEETKVAALRGFNNDDAVRTVKIAMQAAYAKGLNPSGVARPYIISRCLSAATRPMVDYDGDCKADVTVWRPSNVTFFIRPSALGGSLAFGFGNPTDIKVLGDFDGDRKTDIAVFRPDDGSWWVKPSNGTPDFSRKWGTAGDIPVPGDYDGDGITDFAVYRPSTRTWWITSSVTGDSSGTIWPVADGIPVPGDYDGDGRTDMASWSPSTGMWLILSSVTNNTYQIGWGVSGDIPVPADYDGDGRIDVAVVRPHERLRYIKPSNGAAAYAVHSGSSPGDEPIAGDYDGDNKGDIISWSPSGILPYGRKTALWTGYLTATGSQMSQRWGVPNDLPLGARGAPSSEPVEIVTVTFAN